MGERIPDFGVRQQDLAAFAVVFACLHACLRRVESRLLKWQRRQVGA
jgi:hypothetical protein